MDIAIILLVLTVVGVGVVPLALRALAHLWNDPLREFPAVSPAPDAVRRNFQSFSVGLLNLGWCIHVAVDRDRLHLTPAWLARVAGYRAASVPWAQVEHVGPFGGRAFIVRIGGTAFVGPAWALSPVDPSEYDRPA